MYNYVLYKSWKMAWANLPKTTDTSCQESGKCHFGQLPLLENGSVRVSQCLAIVLLGFKKIYEGHLLEVFVGMRVQCQMQLEMVQIRLWADHIWFGAPSSLNFGCGHSCL